MSNIHFRVSTIMSVVILGSFALTGCGGNGASTSLPAAESTSQLPTEFGTLSESQRHTSSFFQKSDANSPYSAAVLADKPVAYYQLDDVSSTLVDSGPNGITGTYGSSVTHGLQALTRGVSSASGFPGGTSVNPNGLANTAPNALLQPSLVSLEAWFEFNTPTALKTQIPIVAYGDAKGAGYGVYLEGIGNNVDRLYYQQQNQGQAGELFFHGLTHLSPGVVYHVVTVSDGTNVTTYINGLLDRSAPYPGNVKYWKRLTLGLQIGGQKSDPSYSGSLSFPGSIAQVAVYGSALSSQEVLNHYLTGQLYPVITENAVAADSFVDSVGINTHFYYDHAAYNTQFSQVKQLLLASGIRHFRDRMSFNPQFVNLQHELGNANLHGTYVTSKTYTRDQITSYPEVVGNSFEQFESPNEPDDSGVTNWVAPAIAFHEQLYSWIKSNPATANYPVVGPGLAWPHNYALLGDLSAYLDVGNFHDYMGAYNPGFPGGPWNGMLAMLSDAQVTSGSKPIVSTEAGYGTQDGGVTVDYRTDLRYMTRMFFEQFRAGISRTYSFEFIDETFTSAFKAYGLLQSDLTPKPSYNGLTSILGALQDPGPAFKTASLSYSLSGLSTVHHLLMQKRDGTFVLAIWLEVPDWDVETGGDIVVPDESVSLSTQVPFSKATEMKMDENGNFSTVPLSWNNNQTTVDVSDKVSLVTLTP